MQIMWRLRGLRFKDGIPLPERRGVMTQKSIEQGIMVCSSIEAEYITQEETRRKDIVAEES